MDTERFVSKVGVAFIAAVIGAFIPFECPNNAEVPKAQALYIVKTSKQERI